MKKTSLQAGCASLFLLAVASAQEVPVPPQSRPPSVIPESTPVAATDQYRATTKSSFVKPTKGRNPFWPVGFVPAAKSAVAEEQLLRIPIEQYKVTTIILDTPSIAVINGKDYTQGQFLNMTTATGAVKLLITKIEDGFVTVQYKALVGKIPISRK